MQTDNGIAAGVRPAAEGLPARSGQPASGKAPARRGKRRKLAAKAGFIAIGALVALLVVFPIVWMIPSAFKDKRELFSLPNHFLPQKFSLDNFREVFELYNIDFMTTVGSTLAVALTAVAISLVINMLAAYAFARLEFPGKGPLFGLVMLSMFIPGVTILLTSIKLVSDLHLLDTFWGLVLPGAASAYNIFFFRQFFLGIPTSVEEAAILDGSSQFGIFVRIFIPLSVTPMVIIGISTFMGYWNSYLWPTLTIIKNTQWQQVMQVLRILNGSKAGDYGVVVAAALMALVIPVTLFAVFQKYIMQGIAISGIK